MRVHPLDVLSLTFGLILTVITGLLALSIWTDVALDLALLVPVGLICGGILVLVIALVPRQPRDEPPPPA